MKKVFPLLFILASAMASCSPRGYDFRFFALGDMPYDLPEDFHRFNRLIHSLNQEDPAFSVHVGDFKSGSTPCSDEYFLKMRGYFQQFEHPLVYTPGDNEWTDCHRAAAGNYDPDERLDKIRELFFRENKSLKNSSLSLMTQNTVQGYACGRNKDKPKGEGIV